ncbi:MAG: hypothetical protein PVSMB4_13730 [Ktedonobacterales bacterium]
MRFQDEPCGSESRGWPDGAALALVAIAAVVSRRDFHAARQLGVQRVVKGCATIAGEILLLAVELLAVEHACRK